MLKYNLFRPLDSGHAGLLSSLKNETIESKIVLNFLQTSNYGVGHLYRTIKLHGRRQFNTGCEAIEWDRYRHIDTQINNTLKYTHEIHIEIHADTHVRCIRAGTAAFLYFSSKKYHL